MRVPQLKFANLGREVQLGAPDGEVPWGAGSLCCQVHPAAVRYSGPCRHCEWQQHTVLVKNA